MPEMMTGMGLAITRACVDHDLSSKRYDWRFAHSFIIDCLLQCPNQIPLIQAIHESVKANLWTQCFDSLHSFWSTVGFILEITDVLYHVRVSKMHPLSCHST